MTEIPYCPDCKLYWYWVNDKEIEFMLYVFAPIKVKKCPYCEGTNENPPTQRLLDFQKVGRKEMSLEKYKEIYG